MPIDIERARRDTPAASQVLQGTRAGAIALRRCALRRLCGWEFRERLHGRLRRDQRAGWLQALVLEIRDTPR